VSWRRPIGPAILLAGLVLLPGCRPRAAVVEPELVFGAPGEHEGEFHMPREVGFSPDGSQIYILDRTHRVQAFTPSGKFLKMWKTPLGSNGNPRGLDVAPDGSIYVADTHNSQIVVYSPEGKLLRKWGRYGKAPGEFISVTDVALDSQGNVWTCEYGEYNDRVQKFDAHGKPVLSFGKFGEPPAKPGEFSRPQGIAVDRHDRLYVADAVNHRIQVISPDGKVELVWGQVGSAPGKLRYPYDVSFDRHGRLYVVEFGNQRVSVFTPEGRFLTCFGSSGRGPGQFDHPWGVNVARNGDIYVSDTHNYRIQKFPPLQWSGPRELAANERK
jgi:DNA-binding beta-propeller fold protein YncE